MNLQRVTGLEFGGHPRYRLQQLLDIVGVAGINDGATDGTGIGCFVTLLLETVVYCGRLHPDETKIICRRDCREGRQNQARGQ